MQCQQFNGSKKNRIEIKCFPKTIKKLVRLKSLHNFSCLTANILCGHLFIPHLSYVTLQPAREVPRPYTDTGRGQNMELWGKYCGIKQKVDLDNQHI